MMPVQDMKGLSRNPMIIPHIQGVLRSPMTVPDM